MSASIDRHVSPGFLCLAGLQIRESILTESVDDIYLLSQFFLGVLQGVMTILEAIQGNLVSTTFFIVFCFCIIFFTNISIDKLVVLFALVGAGIIMYKTSLSNPTLLTMGLIGIIVVLLFSMATGVGRSDPPIVIKQDCKPKRMPTMRDLLSSSGSSSECTISKYEPAGICPNGYTNFTDGDGNTLCCASSNIDPYSHKCPAAGPNGICAMAPGLEDSRSPDGKTYPLCQNVRYEQSKKRGSDKCPSKFPNYLQLGGSSYSCCGTPVTVDATKCPDKNNSCSSLVVGKTIFTSPDSCETLKFLSTLAACPSGTNLNPKHYLSDSKTVRTLNVPACSGSSNICYPRAVIEKCILMGGCSKINIDKSLANCDVYDKLFNKRSIEFKDVDSTAIDFFA